MFFEFKNASEPGAKVSVNVHSIAWFAPADDSTTHITFIGGAPDLWVAEKYDKVKAKILGRAS